MALTEKQVWAASKIDSKVQKLLRTGKDDTVILVAMIDHMPRFEELLDTTAPQDLDELTRKFSGFRRYASILEALAGGIQSGAIAVPPSP